MKTCGFCEKEITNGRSNRRYCNDVCRTHKNDAVKQARFLALPLEARLTEKEKTRQRKLDWYRRTNEMRRAVLAEKYHHDETYRVNSLASQAKYRERTLIKRNVRERQRYQELRLRVLSAYGSKCNCCNETELKFLCIDHSNGGGRAHRKQLLEAGIGAGAGMYKWLERNKFPSGFQVLCHNCNMAKGFYGECPHVKTKQI